MRFLILPFFRRRLSVAAMTTYVRSIRCVEAQLYTCLTTASERGKNCEAGEDREGCTEVGAKLMPLQYTPSRAFSSNSCQFLDFADLRPRQFPSRSWDRDRGGFDTRLRPRRSPLRATA